MVNLEEKSKREYIEPLMQIKKISFSDIIVTSPGTDSAVNKHETGVNDGRDNINW